VQQGSFNISHQHSEVYAIVVCSSFLSATHLVGSGELLDDESKSLLANERSAFAIGASLAASRGFATNELPATEAVMLRVNDDYPIDEFAFFQCVIRYVERDGKTLVTRVCSHQLPVAKSISDFLESVDEDVVPVILGKEAVYRYVPILAYFSFFTRSHSNLLLLDPCMDEKLLRKQR
jgi:hypothetical protein